LKQAYAAKNIADMDTAQTELQNSWNAASEEMYKATQDGGAHSEPAADSGTYAKQPAGSETDSVTDVDFEEVK